MKYLISLLLPITIPLVTLAAPQPRTIVAMTELSGATHESGEECRVGFQVAINNHLKSTDSIKVNIVDHQRLPKVGLTELKKQLDTENVVGIINAGSPVALAINPLSMQKKIPNFGLSAVPSFTTANPYAIRTWANAEVESSIIEKFVKEKNFKDIAMVSLTDDYTLAIAYKLKEKFGSKILFSQEILKEDTDFSSLITKLKQKNPDVIILNILGEQSGLFVKRLRELKETAQIVGTFSLGKLNVQQVAGGLNNLAGTVYAELNGNKPIFKAETLKASPDSKVSGLGYYCYLTLATALELLEENPKINSGEELMSSFLQEQENNRTFKVLDEEVQYKNREIVADMKLVRIE